MRPVDAGGAVRGGGNYAADTWPVWVAQRVPGESWGQAVVREVADADLRVRRCEVARVAQRMPVQLAGELAGSS